MTSIWLSWSVLLVLILQHETMAEPQVPCYFIFGDSLVDNGNNNKILSLARADYPPYGIDFPWGHTGRFSNGKSFVDVIAERLGFEEYIPSHATAWRQNVLKGLNYASAAAGIRDETGQTLGAHVSFNGQLNNHKTVVSQIAHLLGNNATAADYLGRCIYTVGMGSNDYLNNYFLPNSYPTSNQYTPWQYANVLMQQYSQQLTTLYSYGARKIALIGIGPIGCSPSALSRFSKDGRTCIESMNGPNRMFNRRLISLVDTMNTKFADAKFIYVNAYGIFQDLINRPQFFGLNVTNVGCCGVGRNNGQLTCLPFLIPCQNRNEYLFWDAFHPTEATNVVFGNRSYHNGSAYDTYPIDIYRLAQLQIQK